MEKDPRYMTPDELRAYAAEKEQEDVVVKVGFLKFDLYYNSEYQPYYREYSDYWLLDKKTKDKVIQDFKNSYEKVLEKGTEFNCYIIDGKERWFDTVDYGVEMMDADWAKKYLENIYDNIPR